MFFLFRKKERTKEKSIGSFSRMGTFYSFYGLRFSLYERRRGLRCLSLFLSAMSQRRLLFSLVILITRGCYLERFGIPRIEYSCLGRLRPRRVHRHASGAAQGKVGALPALNHKPELSAGRCHPDAIRLYEHRFIVRAHHILKWARMVVLGERASV